LRKDKYHQCSFWWFKHSRNKYSMVDGRHIAKQMITKMWANAQRDMAALPNIGAIRWHLLFNAAKFR